MNLILNLFGVSVVVFLHSLQCNEVIRWFPRKIWGIVAMLMDGIVNMFFRHQTTGRHLLQSSDIFKNY